MLNFEFHNPVHLVFGKGTIAKLTELVPVDRKVLILYGGGSIKRNGVYDQVVAALGDVEWTEFGGIEANPDFDTCMKAVNEIKAEGVGYLISVGGGSVLDACKFIAAAVCWDGEAWDMFADRGASIAEALPFGAVLTLPATGSEMNRNAVISRRSTKDKVVIVSEKVYPQFSILDPETTFTLSERQTANGIVDAFVHVTEQYLTFPVNSPVQDRQAEAILLTLIEEGPKVLAKADDYEARANVMWAATNALNGLLGCGVPSDWATHLVGHELTALYGLDHAQTLAIVWPGVMQFARESKAAKLLQFGQNIWGIGEGDEVQRIDEAILRTEEFFRSLGVGTRLADYGVAASAADEVGDRLARRGVQLGENGAISGEEAKRILNSRA